MVKADDYSADINKVQVRLAVASALVALSVGILAIMHDHEKIFGFFIVSSGVVVDVYNLLVLLLMMEIMLGVVFFSFVGIAYRLDGLKHNISGFMQNIAYNFMVDIFPFSVIAIFYNIIMTRIIGIDDMVSVAIAAIVVMFVIAGALIVVYLKNRERKRVK